jgi:hypothetical protein
MGEKMSREEYEGAQARDKTDAEVLVDVQKQHAKDMLRMQVQLLYETGTLMKEAAGLRLRIADLLAEKVV